MDIEPLNPSGVLVARQFDSFEELSEIAVGWDSDFRQLDAERFNSEILLAQIGSILLANGRFGCHVDQRGATPAGMRTFAVPDVDCSEMHWFGHAVEQDVLLTFPSHGELEAYSRPGFNVTTFSIPEDLLAEYFERNGGPELRKILGPAETITRVQPSLLNGLRYLLRQAAEKARNPGSSISHDLLFDDIQNGILFSLFQILSSIKPVSMKSAAIDHFPLKRVLEFIDAHIDEPLRISDLYADAEVSESTFLNLFKQQLGMTPKSYLAGQRLYGVHRELWRSDPSNTLVSRVAESWGFWHMSQFAADYRRLFGELPSTTLKRRQ